MSMKSRVNLPLFLLIAVLVVLFLPSLFVESKPINVERTTKNRTALAECGEDRTCYRGGFVVIETGSKSRPYTVKRITSCDSCPAEIQDVILFIHKDDDWFLNWYSEVVLPHDRKRWEEVAVMHAEQFVPRH